MSYGFEILDNQGTPVVSDFRVMHLKATRALVAISDSGLRPNPDEWFNTQYGIAGGIDDQFVGLRPDTVTMRTFSGTWQTVSADGGVVPLPPNVAAPEDMIFVQLGGTKYFTSCAHIHYDFPSFPDRILPVIRGNVTDSRVFGPTPPPTGALGTYGMQLFNASGTCVFDSRLVNFGIPQAYVISESTIADILENGTTVNLTLPFSMPSCWVAAPFWEPLRIVKRVTVLRDFRDIYRVRIRQTSNTNIRLDRVLDSSQDMGPANPFATGIYVQTLVLFVMRNA
jgi:hypothetical protein